MKLFVFCANIPPSTLNDLTSARRKVESVTELNDTLQLPMPDDWHVHFRNGELMTHVAPYTAMQFGRALIMPNTAPAIRTAEDIVRYRAEIADVLRRYPYPHFQPMIFQKWVLSLQMGEIQNRQLWL